MGAYLTASVGSGQAGRQYLRSAVSCALLESLLKLHHRVAVISTDPVTSHHAHGRCVVLSGRKTTKETCDILVRKMGRNLSGRRALLYT